MGGGGEQGRVDQDGQLDRHSGLEGLNVWWRKSEFNFRKTVFVIKFASETSASEYVGFI